GLRQTRSVVHARSERGCSCYNKDGRSPLDHPTSEMTTDAPAVDRPATSHAFAGAPETLVTFVPRLVPELLRRGVPSYTSIDGSMLSADISGFTALSERLAGKGKAGAEEITELVNRCFTALIEAAHEYDGEVIKFGGDALLVLFRGDAHATRAV